MDAATDTIREPTERAEPALLRGTEHGLELVVDCEAAVDDMAEAIEGRLSQSPGFFAGSDVVVRSDGPLPVGALARLEQIAAQFQLRIVEIGPPPKSKSRRRATTEVDAEVPAAVAPEAVAQAAAEAAAEAAARAEADAKAAIDEALATATRIVVGPVRSGTVLESTGHLVVIGDVNPGAELRAGRSVIVLGSLRGIAHAGLGGGGAFIFAHKLAPQQLRIGSLIARPGDAEGSIDKPEIAFAAGDGIVVEDFRGKLPGGLSAADL